jgi:hypothetical protein
MNVDVPGRADAPEEIDEHCQGARLLRTAILASKPDSSP